MAARCRANIVKYIEDPVNLIWTQRFHRLGESGLLSIVIFQCPVAVLSVEAQVFALYFNIRSHLALALLFNSAMQMPRSPINHWQLRPSYVTLEVTTSFFARGVVERAIPSQ